MKRAGLDYLKKWKDKKTRKPLIIRGARQVGKSYLVRLFAKEYALDLLEINFELNNDYIPCLKSKDPKQIITLLELKSSQKVAPGKTLLFLDEIQAAHRRWAFDVRRSSFNPFIFPPFNQAAISRLESL